MSTCATNEMAASEVETTDFKIRATCLLNERDMPQTVEVNNKSTISAEDKECNDALIKVPALLTGRERRNISPTSCVLHESFADPQSPSSSSSTSQATSANDVTFEPTIEMMVNDFDDEQTLNEEEALASLESQDPEEEINTLKKESEMPLEELLSKYRSLQPQTLFSEPIRKKNKKTSHKEKHKEKHKLKHKQNVHSIQTLNKNVEESFSSNKVVADSSKHAKANLDLPDAKSINEANISENENLDVCEKGANISLSPRNHFVPLENRDQNEADGNPILHSETPKVRRSHLLDLYPEGMFDNVVVLNDSTTGNSKETLYGAEHYEEDEEIEEEEDEDYKKKVMIGTSYQANIPIGLSQYGDILPYENEDKLIWEPCQVSEREVEEYLIKIRDIKSNQQGEEDEHSIGELNSEKQAKENGRSENKIDNLENNSFLANGETFHIEPSATMEVDSQTVVKDNEQALHLLVQCGYDFKEALRRKRLNALPLNDCMSLWSEEECQKFEEGIQKYGKDFLKIRQHQVRTRTMRELVQFYYLWKKSERRDHNFANADTVDHMDIYLNEDNEYGSNNALVLTPVGSPAGNTSNCTGRNSNSAQKSISIMTTTSTAPAPTNLTSEKNSSNSSLQQQHQHQQQHHKRRTHSGNHSSLNVTTASDNGSDSSSNAVTFSNK